MERVISEPSNTTKNIDQFESSDSDCSDTDSIISFKDNAECVNSRSDSESTDNFMCNEASTSNNASKAGNRRYDNKYLKLGFFWNEDVESPLPFCLLCKRTLANESMVPSKLGKHQKNMHVETCQADLTYFENLLKAHKQSVNQANKLFPKKQSTDSKLLLASYYTAQTIAQKKKPHSDAQELILPCVEKIVELFHGRKAADEIKKIPLSKQTIGRRIDDMNDDMKEQLITKLKGKEFSIIVDEATDIAKQAKLLFYIKFIDDDNSLVEEYLTCKELKANTTGADIYRACCEMFREFKLDWKNLRQICTDGAPAMTSRLRGFTSRVKVRHPHVQSSHCVIHKESLMCKTLPFELQPVMQLVIDMVNAVKANGLDSRLFSQLCESLGSEYTHLLYHSEVRWLSKGQVLKRVYLLKHELKLFFQQQKLNKFVEALCDKTFVRKLAYLTDIFGHLNDLNLQLQGQHLTVIDARDKMTAFRSKLGLWSSLVDTNDFSAFPLLNEADPTHSIKQCVSTHLRRLWKKLRFYFPKLDNDNLNWVINPFEFDIPNYYQLRMKEEIIDLRNHSVLKCTFSTKTLYDFWIEAKITAPMLSGKALGIFIHFASTYRCEQGFSTMSKIKTKYRSLLKNLDAEMRLACSKIEPRLDKLINKKQQQASH